MIYIYVISNTKFDKYIVALHLFKKLISRIKNKLTGDNMFYSQKVFLTVKIQMLLNVQMFNTLYTFIA